METSAKKGLQKYIMLYVLKGAEIKILNLRV